MTSRRLIPEPTQSFDRDWALTLPSHRPTITEHSMSPDQLDKHSSTVPRRSEFDRRKHNNNYTDLTFSSRVDGTGQRIQDDEEIKFPELPPL